METDETPRRPATVRLSDDKMNWIVKLAPVLVVCVPMAVLCLWGAAMERQRLELSVSQTLVLVVLGFLNTAAAIGWVVAVKDDWEHQRSAQPGADLRE
jgi:hypothetical protein